MKTLCTEWKSVFFRLYSEKKDGFSNYNKFLMFMVVLWKLHHEQTKGGLRFSNVVVGVFTS